MNERTFKQKLRSLILPHCYIQSMSSLATAGTPDLYLSGKKDCWIEVKFDEKTKGAIKPKLSTLQLQWCNNRYDEGRQVLVLVGTSSKEGILFTNGEWDCYGTHRLPLKEIITQILGYVL